MDNMQICNKQIKKIAWSGHFSRLFRGEKWQFKEMQLPDSKLFSIILSEYRLSKYVTYNDKTIIFSYVNDMQFSMKVRQLKRIYKDKPITVEMVWGNICNGGRSTVVLVLWLWITDEGSIPETRICSIL